MRNCIVNCIMLFLDDNGREEEDRPSDGLTAPNLLLAKNR